MNKNHLPLIYGRRDRNCCTMENMRYLYSAGIGTFQLSSVKQQERFLSLWQKHLIHLPFLCKRWTSTKFNVIRKLLALTKMWRYNTKPRDQSKGKMRLPYFEYTWILNGMKMPWYSVRSVLFQKPTYSRRFCGRGSR